MLCILAAVVVFTAVRASAPDVDAAECGPRNLCPPGSDCIDGVCKLSTPGMPATGAPESFTDYATEKDGKPEIEDMPKEEL